METKSQAAKTLSFKMKDAPKTHQPIGSDYASHQMGPQIKGSEKHQEHQEDEGCV